MFEDLDVFGRLAVVAFALVLGFIGALFVWVIRQMACGWACG